MLFCRVYHVTPFVQKIGFARKVKSETHDSFGACLILCMQEPQIACHSEFRMQGTLQWQEVAMTDHAILGFRQNPRWVLQVTIFTLIWQITMMQVKVCKPLHGMKQPSPNESVKLTWMPAEEWSHRGLIECLRLKSTWADSFSPHHAIFMIRAANQLDHDAGKRVSKGSDTRKRSCINVTWAFTAQNMQVTLQKLLQLIPVYTMAWHIFWCIHYIVLSSTSSWLWVDPSDVTQKRYSTYITCMHKYDADQAVCLEWVVKLYILNPIASKRHGSWRRWLRIH